MPQRCRSTKSYLLLPAAHVSAASAQEKGARLSIGIVDHLALVVEDHRGTSIRSEWRPRQTGLARVACVGEVGPRCRHLFRQRLRLRSVAGALRAPRGVVEA